MLIDIHNIQTSFQAGLNLNPAPIIDTGNMGRDPVDLEFFNYMVKEFRSLSVELFTALLEGEIRELLISEDSSEKEDIMVWLLLSDKSDEDYKMGFESLGLALDIDVAGVRNSMMTMLKKKDFVLYQKAKKAVKEKPNRFSLSPIFS